MWVLVWWVKMQRVVKYKFLVVLDIASCGRSVGYGAQKNTTVALLAAARILAWDDDWDDLREPSLYEVMVEDADDDDGV